MKTHVNLGYEMLMHSSRPIFAMASDIILYHHEKWDGSGYPNGYKGEEIKLCGRIAALADVFDALGSQRQYKKKWEDDDIFEYIRSQSGKHFDPALVSLFFDNIETFLDIRARIQ